MSKPVESEGTAVTASRLVDRILIGLFTALTFFFDRFSIDRSLSLGASLGRLWDGLGAPRTRRVREQLAAAMPDEDAAKREVWAREVFLHLGRGLAELILLCGRRRSELLDRVQVDGLENLAAAERQSPTGGIVVVTAHYGNWELACAKMVTIGVSISVLYRGRRQPVLDQILLDMRGTGQLPGGRLSDLEQIPMGRAGMRFVRALEAGRKVVVLLDQDADPEEGVFVSFFGRPASTRSGPLALAALRGVPVVPVFIRRSPDGRNHRFQIHPALRLESGAQDDDDKLRHQVQQVTAVIEGVIRESPGQWIWTHRRWRTQPTVAGDDPGPH